jgi:hypothetical protein
MMNAIKLEDLKIEMGSPLGEGYIAKVYLAQHKTTHKKYAIKIVF